MKTEYGYEVLFNELKIIVGNELAVVIWEHTQWFKTQTDKMGKLPIDPARILTAYKNVCLLGSFEHHMRLVRDILMDYLTTGVDWLDICIDHANILQVGQQRPNLAQLIDLKPKEVKFMDDAKIDSKQFWWNISKKSNDKRNK